MVKRSQLRKVLTLLMLSPRHSPTQEATLGSEWRHEWRRTEEVCRAQGWRGDFLPGKDAEAAAIGVEGTALLRSV